MTQITNEHRNPFFESESPDDFSVVGIVTSAANQSALHAFFDNVRANSNLTYLILQTAMEPKDTLALDELAAHARIPIYRADDNQELNRNCIYVLPQKWDGDLTADRVVSKEHEIVDDSRTSVNRFLFALSNSLGRYAVAVILSEDGLDGLDGLRGIDAVGLVHGLVVIEESPYARQLTAQVAALASDRLIPVLSAEEMPDQINAYVEFYSQFVEGTIADERAVLFSILKQGTGVDFSSYKQSSVLRRVHRRMQSQRVSTLGEYLALLRHDSDEVTSLYQELLIGVTHFFRDSQAFEFLGEVVLPRIIECRKVTKEIRIWVAGCSTGEEVYSIAMLLHPLVSAITVFSCKVFATDLDSKAIAVASRGIYAQGIAKQLTEKQLETYFTRVGQDYQVNRDIRDMVIFAQHNMLNDPPFSQIDLIACRNVLIYLNPEMQSYVLSLFHFALRPDGYLFLGPSESLGPLTDLFQRTESNVNIFQYKLAPQGTPLQTFRTSPQRYDAKDARKKKVLNRLRETDRLLQLDAVYTQLLEDYVAPFIIVDEHDDIVHINGEVGAYLVLPKGKPSHNLFRMIPNHLIHPMRTVLHKVRRDHTEMEYRSVVMDSEAHQDVVNLLVRPFDVPGREGQLTIFLFAPVEDKLPDMPLNGGETWHVDKHDDSQHVMDLQRELASVKATLNLTVEELAAAQEAFQTTNEELIVSNEELQSANEELQSINEEFMAVNSEYQHKIQELTELNDDLDNLFVSANIETLFLDSHMDIRKYTPAMAAHFNLREVDLGRSIHDMSHNLRYDTLAADIREVLSTHVVLEREVKDNSGRSFTLRLSPYQSLRELNEGVVLTLFDITALKHASERLLVFSYAIDQSPNFIVITDTDRQIRYANLAYEQISGFDSSTGSGEVLRLYSDRFSDDGLEEVWSAIGRGEQWHGELLNYKKSGEEYRESASLYAIKNRAGVITHFLKIAEDMTQRNETLEALQHSEIMSVIGQLAAGIAHEIRNPLTVLKGFTQLIERETQQKQYIQMMLSEFNHIESIITELLQLAKPHQTRFEVFNVLEPIRDVVMIMELQASLQNVRILVHGATPMPVVRGVPNQLKQVFMNVMKNGLEAMPRGGDLVVEVKWLDAQTIMIRFTDQGMGIPAHILSRIGVPFYTTKEDGTGLGLMVSQKIIDNHHGRLVINSTYGTGTTVDVILNAE